MTLASIIIPVADYHAELVDRAKESAMKQTLPCEVLVHYDHERKGPGFARNEAVLDATGAFLVFLDADDYLEPDFVEKCVQTYQPGRYVYSAWHETDGVHKVKTPCQPYSNGGYHLVTTLYPTKAFKALGGFNEHLPGGEDTDFYLRSARLGICPLYVDAPLVHYTPQGQRGVAFEAMGEDMRIIMQDIYYRNGAEKAVMPCNCTEPIKLDPNAGQMPGMVQAEALYAAMTRVGPATGHAYPRNHFGQGEVMWVYPQDAYARPDWWRVLPTPEQLTPSLDEIMRMAGVE